MLHVRAHYIIYQRKCKGSWCAGALHGRYVRYCASWRICAAAFALW